MSEKTQTLEETGKSRKSSRRSMLRLAVPAAAGVAALAAAGATEALRPGAAHAAPAIPQANGDPLLVGDATNSATTVTQLSMTSTTGGLGTFWAVDESNEGENSFGLFGNSFHNGGVYGLGGGGALDVDAIHDKSYTGVYGIVNNTAASGVIRGYGVKAHANRGLAPLLLISTTGTTVNGAPNTAAANGAVNVDNNGVLYSRRFGAWYPIQSIQYLASPKRLLDARSGASSGLVNRGALGPNELYVLQVAGLAGSGIPAGARGVIGNLTVLSPSAGGNLSVFPDGSPIPTTASMTFVAGAFLANSINSGIGADTKIDIQNQSGGSTPLVFDAIAYII